MKQHIVRNSKFTFRLDDNNSYTKYSPSLQVLHKLVKFAATVTEKVQKCVQSSRNQRTTSQNKSFTRTDAFTDRGTSGPDLLHMLMSSVI